MCLVFLFGFLFLAGFALSVSFKCGGNEVCIYPGVTFEKTSGLAKDVPLTDFSCPAFGPILNPISLAAGRNGIDIGLLKGTDVKAAAAGVVLTTSYDASGLGHYIDIMHSERPLIESRYAHLSHINVRAKESVRKGQKIGSSGDSGNAQGALLYFEIRQDARPTRDPERLCQYTAASTIPVKVYTSGVYDVTSRSQFSAGSVNVVAVSECVRQTEAVCSQQGTAPHAGRSWRTADRFCIFRKSSGLFQVPYSLLLAVMAQESGGKQFADSGYAQGFTQLAPGTAAGMGIGSDKIFDPYWNICGGVHYFARQLKTFGSVECALAAYNAGPGAVRGTNPLTCVPRIPETQNYVASITAGWEKNIRAT